MAAITSHGRRLSALSLPLLTSSHFSHFCDISGPSARQPAPTSFTFIFLSCGGFQGHTWTLRWPVGLWNSGI